MGWDEEKKGTASLVRRDNSKAIVLWPACCPVQSKEEGEGALFAAEPRASPGRTMSVRQKRRGIARPVQRTTCGDAWVGSSSWCADREETRMIKIVVQCAKNHDLDRDPNSSRSTVVWIASVTGRAGGCH